MSQYVVYDDDGVIEQGSDEDEIRQAFETLKAEGAGGWMGDLVFAKVLEVYR